MNNMKRNDSSGCKVREGGRGRLLPIGIRRRILMLSAIITWIPAAPFTITVRGK